MPVISAKAEVCRPEALGEDVRVGPFSYVGPEVAVGAGTVIANSVTVTGRTTVGARCRLFPGCVVGAAPTGCDDPGGCTIEDENVIREHVIVEAGGAPGGSGTVVRARNLLMVGSQVGHDAELCGEGLFANFTRIEHHACIEPYVRTSGFTAVRAYVTVGAYCFTTGYASVEADVPPYAIVQGVPSRVRCVNTENLRRCGFDAGAIERIKGAFRILFDGPGSVPDDRRLRAAEEAYDDEHVRALVASLRRSAASPTGRRLQPAEAG